MKLKFFTIILMSFFSLSACENSNQESEKVDEQQHEARTQAVDEELQEIEAPKTGGLITELKGRYAVVVSYRDGTTARTTATLIEEKKGSKSIRSIKGLYSFNVEGCGYLDFVEAPFLHAVLLPDDADSAHQEPKCIINGGMENIWKIDT